MTAAATFCRWPVATQMKSLMLAHPTVAAGDSEPLAGVDLQKPGGEARRPRHIWLVSIEGVSDEVLNTRAGDRFDRQDRFDVTWACCVTMRADLDETMAMTEALMAVPDDILALDQTIGMPDVVYETWVERADGPLPVQIPTDGQFGAGTVVQRVWAHLT